MKKIPVLLLIFLFYSLDSDAQNSKVISGIISFEGGNLEDAIEQLNEGLSKPSQVKPSTLTKGYLYRAKARLRLCRQQASQQETLLENCISLIWEDLNAARERNDARHMKQIEEEIVSLGNTALVIGSQSFQKSLSDRSRTMLERSYTDLSIAANILGTNYLAYDLLAQSQLQLGDSSGAKQNFEKSISAFQSHPPEKPDQYIAYTFYRLAMIERYQNNQPDNALTIIQNGLKTLEEQYKMLKGNKASLAADAWTSLQNQYEGAKSDLGRFELDVYLNYPSKLNEALDKLAKSVKSYPTDYAIHVAYAQLLERTGDLEKAIETYEKATKISPEQSTAWFNMGALFYNMGATYISKANETEDTEQYIEYSNAFKAYFKKALPCFEKTVEINACDKSALGALKTILMQLASDDESLLDRYKQVKNQEQKCG